MKYILLTLAMALIVAVTSCENGKVELPVGDTGADTVDIDKTVSIDSIIDNITVDETIIDDATVSEPIESSDLSETNTESNAKITKPYIANIIYYKPDGRDFVHELKKRYDDTYENSVLYYDTGKNKIKFELSGSNVDCAPVLKINDSVIDFPKEFNIGANIEEIYVESEYIIVMLQSPNGYGSILNIFDYSGNMLLRLFYLSNTGMFIQSIRFSLEDKIIINGSRCVGNEFLTYPTKCQNDGNYWLSDQYSDYLYEDPIYAYGEEIPNRIRINKDNLNMMKKLDPDDTINAIFEIDYIGDGKFGKINMLGVTTIDNEITRIETLSDETTVDMLDISGNYEDNDACFTSEDFLNGTEPPLSESEMRASVPDFLDEDQQLLYRRAKNVYSHLFGFSVSSVEYFEISNVFPNEYSYYFDENGRRILYSQGRYKNWDDFSALVNSVFTEVFFNAKNRNSRFIERYGRLTFIDGDRGGAQYYNSNFQDEFELIYKSDDMIIFNVIGHYSQIWPHEGESYEERDHRISDNWEFTDKFTIRMVNTESGWRFDVFYDTAIDERTESFPRY